MIYRYGKVIFGPFCPHPQETKLHYIHEQISNRSNVFERPGKIFNCAIQIMAITGETRVQPGTSRFAVENTANELYTFINCSI